MKRSVVALIVLPLLIAACAKNSSEKGGGKNPPAQPKDISTMALPDALKTKYDSAVLSCSLWTRMNGPLVLTDTPDDHFDLDLLQDSSLPKVMTLTGRSDIHSLDLQITFSNLSLHGGGLSDNFGAEYTFKNSPIITGSFRGQSATAYPNGPVSGDISSNMLTLDENIPSILVAESTGISRQPNPTVDYAECTIVTTLKAAYQDEWKQDAVGVPPACILDQRSGDPSTCMIKRN